ncbi:hypothetical protein Kpho02_45060 [Kitasatospora phosalacinea]|uniref:Uncharacterized protein n=1 Tax=Kitasatospora phosalacinea TaxID=2065 RepID=A0A9W6QCV0_9ACTN|nr:hypothetical protein [Kitasatospora phosalacinea]GLW72207.1 hypothetical protein Kpho02_45060 [Kitasatospora phosalacinea]
MVQQQGQPQQGGGCLVAVVRPVVVAVVVPLRLLWELVVLVGRGIGWVVDKVLLWPLRLLWNRVLWPVIYWLVVVPVGWLWRWLVVVPLTWLWEWVLLPVLKALWNYVLAPIGRGTVYLAVGFCKVVAWLAYYLVAVPVRAFWRWVLVPIGKGFYHGLWRPVLFPVLRALWLAFVWAWRLGGRIWRFTVVAPCRWVRRSVWWPVKAEVRRVAREVRRALFG